MQMAVGRSSEVTGRLSNITVDVIHNLPSQYTMTGEYLQVTELHDIRDMNFPQDESCLRASWCYFYQLTAWGEGSPSRDRHLTLQVPWRADLAERWGRAGVGISPGSQLSSGNPTYNIKRQS